MTRQYYFQVNACRATDIHDPSCICWHDEGSDCLDASAPGFRSPVFEGSGRGKIFTWRDKHLATPAPAQPDPLHVANERGEGWQPIETAPKDQFILLAAEFDGPGDWRIKMGEYRSRADEQGRHWHLMGASWHPTRWMPLPPPPAAPKEKP